MQHAVDRHVHPQARGDREGEEHDERGLRQPGPLPDGYEQGQEEETAKREKVFPPYQVNAQLVAEADKDVIVMHCLPAHRNHELTDEVADGPHSVIFPQAHNRLHAQKAILGIA